MLLGVLCLVFLVLLFFDPVAFQNLVFWEYRSFFVLVVLAQMVWEIIKWTEKKRW